ncbi:hypothetical protein ABIA20_006107 [Sinorhizobium fredii]
MRGSWPRIGPALISAGPSPSRDLGVYFVTVAPSSVRISSTWAPERAPLWRSEPAAPPGLTEGAVTSAAALIASALVAGSEVRSRGSGRKAAQPESPATASVKMPRNA